MLGFDQKFISAADQENDPALQSMKIAVENAKENNPFVVYEATGNDLVYAIFDIAKNEDGVHLEKALGITGALAGYSCAMVAGLLSEQGNAKPNGPLKNIDVDTLLVHSNTSLYRILSSKADVMGTPAALDLNEMIARHDKSAGSSKFSAPRLPKGRHLDVQPLTFVLDHWHELFGILNRYDEHFAGWPLSWAAAGAQLMEMGQEVLPANEAVQIVMECAMPMSRLGPSTVSQSKSTVAA